MAGTQQRVVVGGVGTGEFDGILDDVVYYASHLSTARIDAHYAAWSAPWNGDLTGERIGRVLTAVGVSTSTAERDLDVGITTLGNAALGSQNSLTYLRTIEDTENGYFFVSNAGKYTFIDRQTFQASTRHTIPAATFGDTTSETYRYSGFEVGWDDELVRNDVRVTRENGVTISTASTASADQYGPLTLERTGQLMQTDAEARASAQFLRNKFQDPHPYVPRMELRPVSTADYSQALGRELMDRVRVKRRPPGTTGAAVMSLDCFVEGVAHEFAENQWTTVLSLSPASTADNYLVLNSTTRGALDANRLGY